MNDLDELLRFDARRWRAAQSTDLDLDAALADVMSGPARRRRLSATLAVAATIVVVLLVAGSLVLNRRQPGTQATSATSSNPAASPSSVAVTHRRARPTESTSIPSDLSHLPGVGAPPQGQRTLLAATGRTSRTWTIPRSKGRGEIYALCIGHGTIKIEMPGSGGFDVGCDSAGTTAGASIPQLHRTVRIIDTDRQAYRIAVFGP